MGELLEIEDAVLLARLDRYEGHVPEHPEASLFRREEARVTLVDGRTLPCEVYALSIDPGDAPEIAGGDWSARAGPPAASRSPR